MSVIVNDDGSVSFEHPAPAVRRAKEDDFDENLAETLPDGALSTLTEEYLNGVAIDIMSRSEFIANYNRGVDLLGLKIEMPSRTKGANQSISKVRHPALLEACVRYQSGARAELLPAAGPVKAATIGAASAIENTLASDFESDFNYYLTDIAKEYYPDTDRALFYQAFGGTVFKKVFRCPIRRRPVSESVYLTNLIVSEDATDLDNAVRVTNEILMSQTQMRKMQLSGGWRDIALGQPMQNLSPARRKVLESQGIAPASSLPQDQQYTVYEGYCDIDPADYGIEERKAPEGMPLPYQLVLDRDSRNVLSLRRNWKKGDETFLKRKTFVKFGLIPGLGFLDYGFLHLIGNQTRALTAIWQIMVDAGMLSNFPGGMRVKGVRTSTNEIAPGLGEFVDIDISQFDDIRKAVMAMPYKDVSPVLFQLAEAIGADAQRMSGAVEMEVGEGRANIPVGTVMAMIEQQTQVMGAVHKRNHTAQKEELCLLRDLFVENPQDLWRLARNPARKWEVGAEFSDLNIRPASDPNVPAQMHRLMQATALETLAGADPQGFRRYEVHKRTLRQMGISDGDTLLVPPEQQQAPPQGSSGGAGQAAVAKAQLELPLKQGEQQLKQQQIQLQAEKVASDRAENQREAANQVLLSHERTAEQEQEAAFKRDELALEHAKLAQKHDVDTLGLALDHAHHGAEMDQAATEAAQGLEEPRLTRPKKKTEE